MIARTNALRLVAGLLLIVVPVVFTVFNNGDGQRSWLYLDDVSLEVCR